MKHILLTSITALALLSPATSYAQHRGMGHRQMSQQSHFGGHEHANQGSYQAPHSEHAPSYHVYNPPVYRQDHRYEPRQNWNRYNDYRVSRWDSGWRNDNRYNWYDYRSRNQSYFSPGRYYAPRYGSNYGQINIGFTIGSSYYSNNYWINNPSYYRIPQSYGPYRWVRYYDDVLLVDIRNGAVVDVINNFFW
jgi:hypothetical protein